MLQYVLRDDRLDDMLPGLEFELVKDRPSSLGVFWTRARDGWVCFSSECEWWIMMFIALTRAVSVCDCDCVHPGAALFVAVELVGSVIGER